MTILELRFLGGVSIQQDGVPLTTLRSQKGQALLCYLAVTGKDYSRSALAGLLWPDVLETSARASLRKAMYQLKQHLAPYLVSTQQTISFNWDASYRLDVAEFEAGLTAKSDMGRLQEAVSLYQGDFLDGFYLPDAPPFDEWVLAQRARLREMALSALQTLVTHFTTEVEYETAIRYTRQLLDIEPWREEAHRDLIQLLALSGQRSAALIQYERCRRILTEELGVEPAPATVNLYEQIRQNQFDKPVLTECDIPAVLSPSEVPTAVHHNHPIPHNLPAQSTPFIGRASELAALGQYLADPTIRLITILGPGGIGKTRLALAAAEAHLSSQQQPALFPQSVYFVSLAGLETAASLVPTIAEALNFRFYEGDEPKAQLLRYLRQKAMLLILDNFEHLRVGAGLVDEILQTAPGIKLLVTSREKLNRQAEQLFPLGGMALPQEESTGEEDSTTLSSYSAIQLFCQSAQRVRPDFALTAENQSDALTICRLVQGMPLGIVLAATWLEVLTPSEIVDEMSQSLDFLATDMADVPERQRSLRAAFNHSWRLLSQREQDIFRQLSIFRGGFTRTAAKAVTGASLHDMQALVNKSLLSRTPGGRYEVHELLRQFAAEELAQQPDEETTVRDRHSAHYCAFLHEHSENWHTGQQLQTLAAMTREAKNVRRALRWALARGKWQRLAQAIDSWGWYHDWQGGAMDGESFCQAIIDKAEVQDAGELAVPPNCLRVWVKARAWMDWFAEDYRTVSSRAEQSLALLERPQLAGHDTRREKAFVRLMQAILLVVVAPNEARSLYEQILIEYQALADPWGIAECLYGLGRLDFDTGHFASALERMQAVEQIHRERGDRRRQVASLSMLAFIHMDLGHLDNAERLHREALSLSLEIDYRGSLGWRKAALARTLLCQGKLEEAFQRAGESLATVQEQGDHRNEEATARLTICSVQIYAGHYEQAHQQLLMVSGFVENEGANSQHAWIHHLRGLLALTESSYIEAQSAFATSIRIWHSTYPHHFVPPLAALGLATFRLGQLSQAWQHLTGALANALTYKSVTQALATLPVIALALAANGNAASAVELWALAKGYPFVANSKWFDDVAGWELDDLAATLPPEVAEAAEARGRTLDLWETAAQVLEELASDLLDKDGR